jgi:hypothetical protein
VNRPISFKSANATNALTRPIPTASTPIQTTRGVMVKSPNFSPANHEPVLVVAFEEGGPAGLRRRVNRSLLVVLRGLIIFVE